MRYVLNLAVCLCLAVAANAVPYVETVHIAAPPTHTAIRSQVVDPYVEIASEKDDGTSVGSGVYVGDGLILTAAHVVQGATKVTAYKRSLDGGVDVAYECEVVRSDADQDLACVSVKETKGLRRCNLDPGVTLEYGEECWYVGTPHGLHCSLERSVINSPQRKLDKQDYFLANGIITFGNSGGPLYVLRNGRWVLAGIASFVAYPPTYQLARPPGGFCHPTAVYKFLKR